MFSRCLFKVNIVEYKYTQTYNTESINQLSIRGDGQAH
jgi:hypothetical protein